MPAAQIDVLGIGNAIVDLIARVDDAFIERYGLVKGSMNLIDEARAEQINRDMGPALEISGGSAANTVAGVASLGGRAAYFGKVKADALGAVFTRDIRAQGVSFDSTPAMDGPATARSFILVTPEGERTMNTYLGACVNLTTSDIDRATVESAQVTYMEGYLWDRPAAKQAFQLAARMARECGRLSSITLSDSFCVERHRDSFLELIRNDIDIVFANESEIKSLYQTQSFDGALAAIRRDCRIGVLTRSAAGCVVVSGEESQAVPAYPVGKVIDVTGAGDLFAAGFLFGFTKGKNLVQCARLGALAAAEVITHLGARPAVNLARHAEANGLL
ncbi:MAG: adenosine kinase [Pseudomonadota bacterium]|nr:adenosine kinase [Pseudomonadota bacterium]